jgi:hypothetical protein
MISCASASRKLPSRIVFGGPDDDGDAAGTARIVCGGHEHARAPASESVVHRGEAAEAEVGRAFLHGSP